MTNRLIQRLKLLCIASTLALGACGGGSDSTAPTPVAMPAPAPVPVPGPVVVVPKVPDAKSTLDFRLLNTRSQAAGRSPLESNPYNGFSFSANDKRVEVRSPAIQAAQSYADLRTAIEDAINALKPANPALANIRVTLGSNFTVIDPPSGRFVTGQSILVADFGDAALPINTRIGWLEAFSQANSGNYFYVYIGGEIQLGE